MEKQSRKRGRPVGTGKDDRQNLIRMAELKLARSDMGDWRAAGIVARSLNEKHVELESVIRRLYRGWQKKGAKVLAEMRRRNEAPLPAPAVSFATWPPTAWERMILADAARDHRQILDMDSVYATIERERKVHEQLLDQAMGVPLGMDRNTWAAMQRERMIQEQILTEQQTHDFMNGVPPGMDRNAWAAMQRERMIQEQILTEQRMHDFMNGVPPGMDRNTWAAMQRERMMIDALDYARTGFSSLIP